MKASPLESLHNSLQQDPCDLEPTESAAAWSYGPELLLVMIALLAVGMVAGMVTAGAASAILAFTTGAVLLGTLGVPQRRSIAE